jgi:hypothetical protein
MNNIELGYVYILSNKEYPNRYKIGKTKDNPIIRARTLSKQTAALGEFNVEWSKIVPDMNIAELILHYKFAEFHVEKEFFMFSLDEAKNKSEEIISDFFRVEYKLERINLAKILAIKKLNEINKICL